MECGVFVTVYGRSKTGKSTCTGAAGAAKVLLFSPLLGGPGHEPAGLYRTFRTVRSARHSRG